MADGARLPTPCGGCRQRLREFMALDAPLHLAGPAGVIRTVTLGELLPLCFGPEHLGTRRPTDEPAADRSGRRRPGRRRPTSSASGRRGSRPRLGIVLGSGLGGLADALDDAVAIPYAEIPGFPASTVAGHAGRLLLGRLDGVPVACMQGRFHLYEGHPPAVIRLPIRAFRALGADTCS